MADPISSTPTYAEWLVRRTGCRSARYAIVIDSSCPACQPPVARQLADYLNEFCDLPSLNCWHAFDRAFLINIQEEQMLHQVLNEPECPIRALAALGACILEGEGLADLTRGLPHVFQVCLSCKQPDVTPYHLHLNQKRFEPGKVANVIADSFLEWADGGGDPQTVPSLPQTTRSQPTDIHVI
ncbi:MAG: hypothetical protein Q7Q71_08500 [Verrucomicrobiota bacterium JB023]|nr:hypothetical protein [Verrucomicrobiota bacterium JB023]